MSQSLVKLAGNASRSKHLKSTLLSTILGLLKATDLISSTAAHSISSTSMYPLGQRRRAHIRKNSMPRTRIPSLTKQLAAAFSKLIAASEVPKTRSTLRCHGKKPPSKSKANTRNPQEDVKEPKERQPPMLRHQKTAKALWKQAKSASAPRRARITLTIVSINPVVVGRFKLTPRGERKLNKLYKAISRDKRRHLQDLLEAKKAKKRKTTKRRAERLAKWNLEKRFDVREEMCAGAPGFNDEVSERADEDSSPPDSSDDDGDLSDMIEEHRAADNNYHPDTPFNM